VGCSANGEEEEEEEEEEEFCEKWSNMYMRFLG
jgi:hypothetical protein